MFLRMFIKNYNLEYNTCPETGCVLTLFAEICYTIQQC